MSRFGSYALRLVALVIAIQLGVCTLQAIGFAINPMDSVQAGLLSGRFNGTLDHPNNLGKVVFLLLVLVVPLRSCLKGKDVLFWRGTVLSALVVLGLTGGRAVTAAALCMLLLYALMAPGSGARRGNKATIIGFVAVAGVFLAGALFARFDEDPEGGSRAVLTDTAWSQITANPLKGVGPNSYVDVVGQLDPLVASGVPVHNSFLLLVAELGVLGALAMVLPIVLGAVLAAKHFRAKSAAGDASRVFLAALPGVYILATTGWGLVAGYVLPLFVFVFSALTAWMKRDTTQSQTGRSVSQKVVETVFPRPRDVDRQKSDFSS
jgi:O-antigen ligase